MPNLAPLTKKFCELPLLKTIKNFWCRLSIEDLQILLFLLLALYRATWRKKKEIILKKLSVKPGIGVGSEVGVISFLREGCFRAKIRVRVDTNPNPTTACFKKKIYTTSAPTPALRFTDTLLTKAYLDDLNKQTKQGRYIRVTLPCNLVSRALFPGFGGGVALETRLVAMKQKRVTFACFVIQ